VLPFATQAEPQMLAFEHPNLGRLVQPRPYPKVAETAGRGVPRAADNAAFVGSSAAAGEWCRHPSIGPRALRRR